jgi:hypothetical protein
MGTSNPTKCVLIMGSLVNGSAVVLFRSVGHPDLRTLALKIFVWGGGGGMKYQI